MARNWKQFIVLFTIWIITIISTILFAWGIHRIKKGEKLKEIYISFIVLIIIIFIITVFLDL
ncbi:MAG: hypothetical protein KQA34_02700, partial [Candidatus Aenigmarchaeota archaeon]|nr:hypothetical protein [Candidatus Aenigmarchaeota archaeon]